MQPEPYQRPCSVDGCGQPYRAKGYCFRHYMQWRRVGDPTGTSRRPRLRCVVDGCDVIRHGHGYCARHYSEQVRAGAFGLPPCAIEGCEAPSDSLGLCGKHAQRVRRHGDPFIVRKPGPGEGRGHTDKKGYRVITRPGHPNAWKDGKIFEHVFVMAAHLGRPLTKGETVHHKNGIRSDNDIGNLELRVSIHPPGQRVTDLAAFAREVLDRYGDEVARL